MTIILSESDVSGLLDMQEVVASLEASFKAQSEGAAVSSPRTRLAVPGSVMNVMHASLPYLGRAGVKCYLTSRAGTRFVFVLFDLATAAPLAVMGADTLGRYRTGAASAVATRVLLGRSPLRLCICGSGKQALTQVTALATIAKLSEVRVWSPSQEHAGRFVGKLLSMGFVASAADTPEEATWRADVCSAITSSKEPFLGADAVRNLRHLNLCGSNSSDRAEASPDAIAAFQTVVVDDLRQAKAEAGDLIRAARGGLLDWGNVVELKDVIARKVKPTGRTLFKSVGVALEDVAVASLVYDKAVKSVGYAERSVDFGRLNGL